MRRFAEIGPRGVSREDFKISSMNFRHFANLPLSSFGKNAARRLIKLESFSPARMLYAKFG